MSTKISPRAHTEYKCVSDMSTYFIVGEEECEGFYLEFPKNCGCGVAMFVYEYFPPPAVERFIPSSCEYVTSQSHSPILPVSQNK
jgi:hypothetical protein